MNYLYTANGEVLDTSGAPVADLDAAAPRRGVPIIVRYWHAILRHKWVIVAIIGSCLVLGVLATSLMKREYTASTTIEISREEQNVTDVRGVQPEDEGQNAEFYQTQYGLLRARSLAERVANRLSLPARKDFFAQFGRSEESLAGMSLADKQRLAASLLLQHITIAPLRGSGLVDIEFRSPDRQLSADVANAWAEEFIRSNQDRKFASTAGAREFLEGRLADLRKRLEGSERELVTYARQREIVNIADDDTATGTSNERSLVAADLQRLSNALADATAARIAAHGAVGKSIDRDFVNNPALNTLRQRRAEVAADYARLLTQFDPEYPQAQALRSQLADLDASIAREEARVRTASSSAYQEALDRENGLKAKVEQLKARLLGQQADKIQYNIYKRDADTNRQLYDALLQRYKEIGVAGIGASSIAIVDAATVPKGPSSPSLPLNIALALLVGMILSGLSVVTLEQVDQTVKNPEQAGQALDLPVLGAIPYVSDEEPMEALLDPKSAPAEAYVSARTNLSLATDHGLPRSALLTSTRQSEGKSTSAVAIGQAIARLSGRVILIDGDMRNPSLHKLLGISNSAGLSNFLAGDDNLERIIHAGGPSEISIMPAGPRPPSPSELLSSDRLRQLVERLGQQFDHIIIDAPPVLGFADVPLIAQVVQGAIYVVEAGGPKVGAIQASLDRIRQVNGSIFGLILTKLRTRDTEYAYIYSYGDTKGDE
jgi:capsular exopolysaccharide synthesis family protein